MDITKSLVILLPVCGVVIAYCVMLLGSLIIDYFLGEEEDLD